MCTRITNLSALFVAAVLAAGPASAAPIDDTFSYQGRLTNSGAPITGTVDLRFELWDAEVGGSYTGWTVTHSAAPITDGLFNADLRFGVWALLGDEQWLQIEVRHPAGVGGWTMLTPRQKMLGVPYAIQTRGLFVDDDLNVHIGFLGSNSFLFVNDGPNRVGAFGSSPVDSAGYLGMGSGNAPEVWTVMLDADHDDTDGLPADGEVVVRSLGGGDGGILEAQNDQGDPTVVIRGGPSGEYGSLTMFNPSGSPILSLNEVLDGGRLQLFDPTAGANDFFAAWHDSSLGGGGVLTIDRNDAGHTGFLVEGNQGGSESTMVRISGNSSIVEFDTSQTGTASTLLPTDAMQASEMLDEPGVASERTDTSITITGATDTILSRTITVPASGYCVVIGTCGTSAQHTAGATNNAFFGVGDSAVLLATEGVELYYSPLLQTALRKQPVAVHGIFSVSAGAHTFYLLGRAQNGAFTVSDAQLTVMFFPTAYGTVTPTLLARSGADNDASAPRALPMSPAEIKAEQMQAAAFDRNRRDAEFAEMCAMMYALQNQVDDLQHQLDPAPYLTPPARRLDDETLDALGHSNAGSR